MVRDRPKSREERGIFEEFAAAAGLQIAPGSVIQPDPPDILCEVAGIGRVAFELVQLDGREELSRMSDFRHSGHLWADVTRNLDSDVRQRHSNVQINVCFQAGADQRMRRKIFSQMVARLNSLPAIFTGDLFEENPSGLASAQIRRFNIDSGPSIREVSASGPVGVDLSRIEAKVAHYKEGWGVRAELLAYSRWGMPFSDQNTGVEEYLAGRFPVGVFSRAWIFELTSRRVVARAP
jgi:hypothetical protein